MQATDAEMPVTQTNHGHFLPPQALVILVCGGPSRRHDSPPVNPRDVFSPGVCWLLRLERWGESTWLHDALRRVCPRTVVP